MKVSVITPVFNAEPFVERAVNSALAERQTAEVILVEDGSTDGSLKVCQRLVEEHESVRLMQHENGKNRGAAASRNLGMTCATQEYLALLDADDFFLPGRFEKAEEIFNEIAVCDGVYGAVGIEFMDGQSEAQWLASPMRNVRMTTMTSEISPGDLLRSLLRGRDGRFHIDGLVFKKNLLDRSGMMNEKLASMHEDTDFIFRLAIAGSLYPGQLSSPVAVRFVHGGNRISAERSAQKQYSDRLKMHMETYRWCKRGGHKKEKDLIVNRMVSDCLNAPPPSDTNIKCHYLVKRRQMLSWALTYPDILVEKNYWKELAVLTVPSWKKRGESK